MDNFLVDPLQRFADEIATTDQANLFPALETLCQTIVGHRLFSCSVFDMQQNVAARIYTNDSDSYPVSGIKNIVENRWTDIVLDQHKTFVANTVEEFSDVFPDHEKIAALGLGSVVNLPVFLCGTLMGTVNILHESHYYSVTRVALVKHLLLPATIAFQQHNTQNT